MTGIIVLLGSVSAPIDYTDRCQGYPNLLFFWRDTLLGIFSQSRSFGLPPSQSPGLPMQGLCSSKVNQNIAPRIWSRILKRISLLRFCFGSCFDCRRRGVSFAIRRFARDIKFTLSSNCQGEQLFFITFKYLVRLI